MTSTDPLIVPLEVSAMVLNDPAMNILRAQMDYGQLANCESPDPGPFSSDEVNFASDPRNRGVYVLWTLPKGLRRRLRNPDGQTSDFPFVPNRWLVVRLYHPATNQSTPPQLTAWVLQSDGIDPKNGAAAYVDPTQKTVTPTMIGLKTEISSSSPWQEPSNPPPYYLKAVAEGNVGFGAFQAFNTNVFSVFDNLTTLGIGAGTLSYYVIGWYSDPAADVLTKWSADTLAALGWTADVSGGQSTTTSIYQGAAFAVQWNPDGPAPPSPKDGANPAIGIGQTSVDAVVAFTQAALQGQTPNGLTPEQAAELIEAFEYNLLPMLGQPGAELMLESQLRSHWFSSSEGGARWTIVDAEQSPDTAPTPVTPAELAAEALWLDPLGAAQADLDTFTRQLLGIQRQLFSLWWKQGAAEVYYEQSGSQNYPWEITGTDEFTEPIQQLADQARALIGEIAARQALIPAATPTQTLQDAITAFANGKGLPSTRQLKRIAAAPFWAPVDPVAVISHTEHLMMLDPDGTTACRWPQALVSAIELAPGGGAADFSVTAAEVAPMLPALPSTNLPAVCPALYAELFLLDPGNAPQLAAAAGQTLNAAQLSAAAQSMSPPQVVPGAGTAPEELPSFPWTQPWRPVFFDWQIDWFPIPFTGAGGANWAFNGLDYDLIPGLSLSPQNQQLEGRTFLTPKPSFEFKSRIDQFIAEYPDSPITAELKAIEDVVGTVDGWDFLSQALSGFEIQLSGWNPVPTSTPLGITIPGDGALTELVGEAGGYPPASLMSDPQRNPPPKSSFEGMRGGQLFVNRVTIVDAFGQTLEIVKAPVPPDTIPRTSVNNEPFIPLIGDGLVPTEPLSSIDPGRFVQLPPRVLQPARLNVDLLGDSSGNPVIGWLLPDHPDSSIAAYAPGGSAYGALRLGVDANGDPDVAWDAAPNSPWQTLPPPSSELPDFENMLANLQQLGAGALRDFLQSVDESLWTVDPLGARADTFLSVLIGRPLAVVSAALSLELQSAPWLDQAWPYTFTQPSPLLLQYEFPVRLGDLGYHQDGLIGYYGEGAYTQFNCIHLPDREPNDPPLTNYLKPIGPGNYVNLSFGSSGVGAPTKLTLLMDPRAGVHSQCALVPVQQTTLDPVWVNGPLANMQATFRIGPALVNQQPVAPTVPGGPGIAVLLPKFAEQRGVLRWLERTGTGWTEKALVSADDTATLPAIAPTLREGLLKLTGGVDS